MLIMESYVSCIKIRGMPILPPLMTEDRKNEMKYYKKLALAVEDRLKKLRIANAAKTSEEQINGRDIERAHDDEFSSTKFPEQESVDATAVHTPKINEVVENEMNTESTDGTCNTHSDSDTIKIGTDVNKSMNIQDCSRTNVQGTICDAMKPNVPKTLDIVPITVETTQVSESRKSSSDMGESVEEVPKLVRQGSYTLDTPSPMLLAHLENSTDDYIPTAVTNGMRKRVWSSMNVKAEWEYQGTAGSSRLRSNSISGCEDNKENGYHSLCERNERSTTKRHIVRSVDCIPTTISKEFTYKSSKDNKRNNSMDKCSSNDGSKYSDNKSYRTIPNSPNRYIANKFGGSLGALSNKYSQSNKKISRLDNTRMIKSFDSSSTPKPELSCSSETLKPVVVSEKLVHVFKEIQKTHERQMADLMARQQKEQIMMQQEFQKQQLILLAKIEKSFPGVTLPSLAKKIASSSIDDELRGEQSSTCNSISLPKSLDQNNSQTSMRCSNYMQNRSDPETSPINGSSFESDESISLNFNVSRHEHSLIELNTSRERRKSNVSRELFPLESNTTIVPITNGSNYDQRHIQAATKINAYARGYLVRRLMRTERIITLKNTYKEALHCMLKLHIDAPLELAELNFHKRLQHQCDAASISIVELFAQCPMKKMEIIAQDRQIRKARLERPSSARSSYSFATQRTLARKRFKEMGIIEIPGSSRSTCSARTRCQTWTSNAREKRSPGIIYPGIKRSTSAGAVRKPWR